MWADWESKTSVKVMMKYNTKKWTFIVDVWNTINPIKNFSFHILQIPNILQPNFTYLPRSKIEKKISCTILCLVLPTYFPVQLSVRINYDLASKEIAHYIDIWVNLLLKLLAYFNLRITWIIHFQKVIFLKYAWLQVVRDMLMLRVFTTSLYCSKQHSLLYLSESLAPIVQV